MIRKALVWDPYLDTLGGGERYALTAAVTLAKLGAKVILPWADDSVIAKAKTRFGLDLSDVDIDPSLYKLLRTKSSMGKRREALSGFDVIFWVSDGSVPFLFGKKNLLHYQVPFKKINGSTLINQLKLLSIDKIVINSEFTKKVIGETLPNNKSVVVYPPVATQEFQAGQKKKIILNVGRFVSPSHAKRQDFLIDAFRQLRRKKPKSSQGWKLVLAGGADENESYLTELKEMAKGLPVEFAVNPKFLALKELYSKAAIYWHAAGFGIDETAEPEKVEHFGITTVEAMAAGAVPVVINKGGQREIITPESGRVFETQDELIGETVKLMRQSRYRNRLSKGAVKRSQVFSEKRFVQEIEKLVS